MFPPNCTRKRPPEPFLTGGVDCQGRFDVVPWQRSLRWRGWWITKNGGLWRERLRRFQTSGRAVTKICDDVRISVASFYQWRKRLAAKQADCKLSPARVPVCATPAIKKDSVPRLPFVPVQVRPAPAMAAVAAVAAIEIHLPNGARVCLPGGDTQWLRVAIESAAQAYGAILTEAGSC